jgi:hypothetical protein
MRTFALMDDQVLNDRLNALLTLLKDVDQFHERQVADLLDETRALLRIVNRRSGGILAATLADIPAMLRADFQTLQ